MTLPVVLDVTERSLVFLGPGIVDRTAAPTGVGSSSAVGTPQVDAAMQPSGMPSALVFGTATTSTDMAPAGVDASSPGAGNPATTASIAVAGVGSGLLLGAPGTDAGISIVPGPVDPSNDFGNPVVTKRGWIFRPSVNTYQWRLFKEYEGISLLRESGVWSEVAHPDLERTRAAQKYLAGGRDHVVSTSLKAELEGLGYTVSEEVVTTEEYL